MKSEATARLRDEASSRVRDVYDTYKRGEVLVEAGQKIGDEQLILLRLEHEAAMGELRFGDKARRALGIFALVAALYFLAAAYIYRREPRFVENYRRVAMICGLVIAALALIRLLAAQTWNAEIVPVAIVGMIVAIAYNPSFAMMVTFGLSILTCITLGTQIPHFLVVMGGTAAGVLDAERSAHPHQADQGRCHGLGDLLPHHLGDRIVAGPAARPGAQTTASGAPAGA